jgi:cardiolipin synthase
VFEWNGSMLHAKTAVADGRWARVGSSNLNLASWIGNCELDLAVEDETFARAMEAQYETDLGNATEIVLKLPRRWRNTKTGALPAQSDGRGDAVEQPAPPNAMPASPRASARVGPPYPRARGGSSGRAAAGALRLANSVSAAIADRRVLGRSESGPLLWSGLVLLVVGVIGFVWPRVVAWPLAALTLWIGVSLVVRYCGTKMRRSQVSDSTSKPADKSGVATDN